MGETVQQVEVRLQGIPKEDRYIAAMVEVYRLAPNHILLNLIHDLLARYYVVFFTTTDLAGAPGFLNGAAIAVRVNQFNSADYDISTSVPSQLGSLSNLARLYLSGNQLTGSLPQSLTTISTLDLFLFSRNSGLCAPDTTAFHNWLNTIQNQTGPVCGAADRAALNAFFNATHGANWDTSTNGSPPAHRSDNGTA